MGGRGSFVVLGGLSAERVPSLFDVATVARRAVERVSHCLLGVRIQVRIRQLNIEVGAVRCSAGSLRL